MHLDETTISGRAIIYGTLTANKSKFLSDIYSASDSLTFINSTVNGVINMQSSNQPLIEVKESCQFEWKYYFYPKRRNNKN